MPHHSPNQCGRAAPMPRRRMLHTSPVPWHVANEPFPLGQRLWRAVEDADGDIAALVAPSATEAADLQPDNSLVIAAACAMHQQLLLLETALASPLTDTERLARRAAISAILNEVHGAATAHTISRQF